MAAVAMTAGLAAGCHQHATGAGDLDGAASTDAAPGTDAGEPDVDAAPGTDAGEPDVDAGQTQGYDCQHPDPAWLLCEDFEAGDGDFASWFAQSDFLSAHGEDDRGRIDLSETYAHSGRWAIYYPAAASAGYQGSGLDWRACDGPQQVGCSMRSFETLYFRAWVRFAEDHHYVHHFLNIGGSQPDDYWYHGTAGCLPSGELAMGTTVDFYDLNHGSYFYTYFPEMQCDTNCGNYSDVDAICAECASKSLPTCSQQPQCCWGNVFGADPPVPLPVGQWFCLEMTMTANTPGQHDGSMAYWVDGTPAHEVTGMMFRTIPELALNRVRLQHYITESDAQNHSNRVWFDDVVVSTERIGCD